MWTYLTTWKPKVKSDYTEKLRSLISFTMFLFIQYRFIDTISYAKNKKNDILYIKVNLKYFVYSLIYRPDYISRLDDLSFDMYQVRPNIPCNKMHTYWLVNVSLSSDPPQESLKFSGNKSNQLVLYWAYKETSKCRFLWKQNSASRKHFRE